MKEPAAQWRRDRVPVVRVGARGKRDSLVLQDQASWRLEERRPKRKWRLQDTRCWDRAPHERSGQVKRKRVERYSKVVAAATSSYPARPGDDAIGTVEVERGTGN